MIPFMPWRPDQSTLTNSYAEDAVNVVVESVKGDGSVVYAPFNALDDVTGAAASTVYGARGFTAPDGTVTTVLGTATKLYLVDTADNTLTDVSGTTYSAAAGAAWSFEMYGANLIATNVNDGPQRFIVGTDTAFSALSGSPPGGHLVSTWKDQLVIAGLANYPEAVTWSEINDITDWTGGNSDTQVFPGFGPISAVSRGNTPMIVQATGIQRGQFVGGATVFEFDTLTAEFGCRFRGATVFRRGFAYFWTDDGFKAISLAGDVQHIGNGKIDRWVASNVLLSADYPFLGFADPSRPIIGWACKTKDYAPVPYNMLLLYNTQAGEWSRVLCEAEWLLSWRTSGYTLEDLDAFGTLETLPFSLDSTAWGPSAVILGAVSPAHKIGLFFGDPLAASIITGEFEGIPGARSRIRKVRPQIDGTCTLTHYGRDNRADGWSPGPTEPVFARTQEARFNRAFRYHKLALDTAAGTTWTKATGLDEQSSPAARG